MPKYWSPAKFTAAIRRDVANIEATAQGAFRKKLSSFLKDLSRGIIANSPVNPPSKYAMNDFINNTYIVTDKMPTTFDVDQDDSRDYKGPVPSSIANLSAVLKVIQSNQPIPKTITIINESSKGDFQYAQLVQKYGWSKTPAYRPFFKGLQHAFNKHPDMFSTVYSVWSAEDQKPYGD